MSTVEEKNFKNIADEFESYFSEKGFETINYGLELRKVTMEHPDGRYVELFSTHSGLNFYIKGYNFSITQTEKL